MLAMKRMVLKDRRRERAKLMQLKIALLADEPLPGSILLATGASEQVCKLDFCQRVLRVSIMSDHLSNFWLGRGRKFDCLYCY